MCSKLVIFTINNIPKYKTSSLRFIWMWIMVAFTTCRDILTFYAKYDKKKINFLKISLLRNWGKKKISVVVDYPEYLIDNL